MADYRASQVIAASRFEEALARVYAVAALDMEILGVDVLRILHYFADRLEIILVNAAEVADIEQQAEVRRADARDYAFDPVAVLAEEAVILYHGLNAL